MRDLSFGEGRMRQYAGIENSDGDVIAPLRTIAGGVDRVQHRGAKRRAPSFVVGIGLRRRAGDAQPEVTLYAGEVVAVGRDRVAEILDSTIADASGVQFRNGVDNLQSTRGGLLCKTIPRLSAAKGQQGLARDDIRRLEARAQSLEQGVRCLACDDCALWCGGRRNARLIRAGIAG
jgi:hypothetical protein